MALKHFSRYESLLSIFCMCVLSLFPHRYCFIFFSCACNLLDVGFAFCVYLFPIRMPTYKGVLHVNCLRNLTAFAWHVYVYGLFDAPAVACINN